MSLLDLRFFLASLSILASMRRVFADLHRTPACHNSGLQLRSCLGLVGSSVHILQMRFLDQFALDLRSQRTNQPPGGPVPCTTADVRVTELDEMMKWTLLIVVMTLHHCI